MTKESIQKWIENTTSFDRVSTIILSIEEPKSVSYVSKKAHLSENTARSHLKRLVDLYIVHEKPEKSANYYYPEPLYIQMKLLRDLYDNYNKNELINEKISLKQSINSIKSEYNILKPEELRKKHQKWKMSNKSKH